MSFSLQVKQELSEKEDGARHCNIAELSAILNCSAQITFFNGNVCFKLQTENYRLCVRCSWLINALFGFKAPVGVCKNKKPGSKGKSSPALYLICVNDFNIAKKILNVSGLYAENSCRAPVKNNISLLVVSSECCKRAYVRGAFMASGSLSDPIKAYHAEFTGYDENAGSSLTHIINSFGLNAKLLQRKDSYIVYLKDSSQITDLLNIMQAHRALMELANVRIVKDVRNDVNRKVNFETANLNKTISASLKQAEDILYVKNSKGLSYLNDELREAAVLRLTYKDASLKEIGAMLSRPVSKSGMNHRFRKISEIAENIKTER